MAKFRKEIIGQPSLLNPEQQAVIDSRANPTPLTTAFVGIDPEEYGRTNLDLVIAGGERALQEGRALDQNWLELIGKGVGNVVGTFVFETLKMPGYLAGVDNAYLDSIKWLQEQTQGRAFEVFTPPTVAEGDLLTQLKNPYFWASEGANGIGFLLSFMLPGQLIKAANLGQNVTKALARISKLDEAVIDGQKVLANNPNMLGRLLLKGVGKTGRALDFGGMGARVESTAAVLTNAYFEASAEGAEIYDQMIAKGRSEQEAGQAASQVFSKNLPLLLLSNTLVEKYIMNGFGRVVNPQTGINRITSAAIAGTEDVSRISALRKLPLAVTGGVAQEGLLEEGMQTSISQTEGRSFGEAFAKYMDNFENMWDGGQDATDFGKAVVLGGLLGSGMSTVGSFAEARRENEFLFGREGRTPTRIEKFFGRNKSETTPGAIAILRNAHNSIKQDTSAIFNYDENGAITSLKSDAKELLKDATGMQVLSNYYQDLVIKHDGNTKLADQEFQNNLIASVGKKSALNLNKLVKGPEGVTNEEAIQFMRHRADLEYFSKFLNFEGGAQLLDAHIQESVEALKERYELNTGVKMNEQQASQLKSELIAKAERIKGVFETVNKDHSPNRLLVNYLKDIPVEQHEAATLAYQDFFNRAKAARIEALADLVHLEDRKEGVKPLEDAYDAISEAYSEMSSTSGLTRLWNEFWNTQQPQKTPQEATPRPTPQPLTREDFWNKLAEAGYDIDEDATGRKSSRQPALIKHGNNYYFFTNQDGKLGARNLDDADDIVIADNLPDLSRKLPGYTIVPAKDLDKIFKDRQVPQEEGVKDDGDVESGNEIAAYDQRSQPVELLGTTGLSIMYNKDGSDSIVETDGIFHPQPNSNPHQQRFDRWINTVDKINFRARLQVAYYSDADGDMEQYFREWNTTNRTPGQDVYAVIVDKSNNPVLFEGLPLLAPIYKTETKFPQSGKLRMAEHAIFNEFLTANGLPVISKQSFTDTTAAYTNKLPKAAKATLAGILGVGNVGGLKTNDMLQRLRTTVIDWARETHEAQLQEVRAKGQVLTTVYGITNGHPIRLSDANGPLQYSPIDSLDLKFDAKGKPANFKLVKANKAGFIAVTDTKEVGGYKPGVLYVKTATGQLVPVQQRNLNVEEATTVIEILKQVATKKGLAITTSPKSNQTSLKTKWNLGTIRIAGKEYSNNLPVFPGKHGRVSLMTMLFNWGQSGNPKLDIYVSKGTLFFGEDSVPLNDITSKETELLAFLLNKRKHVHYALLGANLPGIEIKLDDKGVVAISPTQLTYEEQVLSESSTFMPPAQTLNRLNLPRYAQRNLQLTPVVKGAKTESKVPAVTQEVKKPSGKYSQIETTKNLAGKPQLKEKAAAVKIAAVKGEPIKELFAELKSFAGYTDAQIDQAVADIQSQGYKVEGLPKEDERIVLQTEAIRYLAAYDSPVQEPVVDSRNTSATKQQSRISGFNKTLAKKIQDKLQALYPEIKLTITENPNWEEGDAVFNQQIESRINYTFKAVDTVGKNLSKIQKWEADKSITQDTLWKKIAELGVPKQQLNLIREASGNTVEEKLISFIAQYNFAVEISNTETNDYAHLSVPGGTNYTENEVATPLITPSIKGHARFATDNGIGWFRSDDKIIAGSEGKWQSDGAGGLVRTTLKDINTPTRRILEVQSDLFQKGRDKAILSSEVSGRFNNEDDESFENRINKTQSNQFLQLLNKDNNWVTFFVKSIIQDSANKGYEKVLFPTGNTASKVEGHTTLERFKENQTKRLELLNQTHNKFKAKVSYVKANVYEYEFFDTEEEVKNYLSNFNGPNIETSFTYIDYSIEINQIRQELERVEREGFGALRPIYNFYENVVANILRKQGYKPQLITDEYGNTWNEIEIIPARDKQEILLQRDGGKTIGQANIDAMTVLIDAVNQKQDTLPHEYAHHYIAWFRDTPIVQEAIAKWGSEEALVQAIGEQVVVQKGDAFDWWKKFVNWILNRVNKLSDLDEKQLAQILTDAFLTRQDLRQNLSNQPDATSSPKPSEVRPAVAGVELMLDKAAFAAAFKAARTNPAIDAIAKKVVQVVVDAAEGGSGQITLTPTELVTLGTTDEELKNTAAALQALPSFRKGIDFKGKVAYADAIRYVIARKGLQSSTETPAKQPDTEEIAPTVEVQSAKSERFQKFAGKPKPNFKKGADMKVSDKVEYFVQRGVIRKKCD